MGRSVFVTGGSRGIGRAVTRRFAMAGDRVLFTYKSRRREAEALEKELKDAGFEAMAVCSDCRDEQAVKEAFGLARKNFGAPEVLICNAGIAVSGMLQDITADLWSSVMDVSARGCLLACQEAVPDLIRSGGGRVVCISSMWGQTGASCESAYSAAKGAVIAFAKSLAKELGPSGITVNTVAPGVIDTEMNACYSAADMAALAEETPLMRIGRPEEVAAAVFFLASEEASFITGQTLGVNGGFVI